MSDGYGIERLRAKLQSVMERKGVAPTTLSLAVGKNPSLVADLFGKTKDVKLSTIEKLAEQLGVTVGSLIADELSDRPVGPTLHVKGAVSAGRWVDAYERPEEEWEAATGRPDVAAPVNRRYFLEVLGDSMNLLYPPGSLIEVVDIHSGIEPEAGKRVVIVRRRADDTVEATVKELVLIDGKPWFVPRSTNPTHQSFAADDVGDGIEEVKIVAIVVGSVRPE